MNAGFAARAEAVILCGGLGTRISHVLSDVPKVLAPIGDSTFLDLTLKMLRDSGIRRVVLATGHLKEKVRERFAHDKDMVFSEEDEPLGTGGALKNALFLVRSETFLVMSGDMLFKDLDLDDFFKFHNSKGGALSMIVAPREREDVGSVGINDLKKITHFYPRGVWEAGPEPFMNGSMYLFNKSISKFLPPSEKFSLEHDFFPEIIKKESCFGYFIPTPPLDIGTPERYASWQKFLN